ncbi:uncharacterized protein BJX67DRAFT_233892 [Aspergillus lucknowensis]|uniref:Extracellular membrane protein CFEM domain-containing protein n=1 Tax=Aspergillus lucknowensis TaxID=176173 RepID=A0ABR4LHD1_9EURO
MKFTLVALSSVLALVAAQESSSTTSGAPATTTSMTAAESCVLRCNDDDRCCKAQCLGVPCPSDEMANDTNDCVANCDQGDGSEADTQAYAQCQARCYTTHYFPATVTVSNGASSTGTDSTATSTGDSSDSNSDDSNTAPPPRKTQRRPVLRPSPRSSLVPLPLVWPASSWLRGLCKRRKPPMGGTRVIGIRGRDQTRFMASGRTWLEWIAPNTV